MTQINKINNYDGFNYGLYFKEEFDEEKYSIDGDTDDSEENQKQEEEEQLLPGGLIKFIDTVPDPDKNFNKESNRINETNISNDTFINTNNKRNNFCFFFPTQNLNNFCDLNNMNNMSNNTNNAVNSLLPLISCGYEFVPKSFNKKMMTSTIKNGGNQNSSSNKKIVKNGKPHKLDWICSFCNNCNFSFRKKCNRCHVRKEESELKVTKNVQ